MSNRLNLPEIGEPLKIDSFSLEQKESLLWYHDISPANIVISGAKGLFSVLLLPVLMLFVLILVLSPMSTLDDQSTMICVIVLVAVIILDPLLIFGISYISPLYKRTYIMTDKRIVIISAKNQIYYVSYNEINNVKLAINPLLRNRGKVSVKTKGGHSNNPLMTALNADFFGRKEDCEKVYSIAQAQITAQTAENES